MAEENVVVAGNVVSAIVFWPVNNESLTATAFLLICLAVADNVMLVLYYALLGVSSTCRFYDTCQYYLKVRVDLQVVPQARAPPQRHHSHSESFIPADVRVHW